VPGAGGHRPRGVHAGGRDAEYPAAGRGLSRPLCRHQPVRPGVSAARVPR
jgi:hypothetical protein